MKKSMLALLAVVMSAAVLGLLSGCNDDQTGGTGELKLYLVDAPAGYDSVIVVVREVAAHSETQGWIVVNDTSRTFDLLRLSNGVRSVLGWTTLEAGRYTQIRLLLDSGNYVVVGGIRHSITVPSGFQTGIKLIHQFRIDPDYLYELYVDFDAGRSVVLQGNGEYMLKPTIRVYAEALTGTISGIVWPPSHLAVITAMSATDTAGTFADELTAEFKVMALPAASYNLRIQSTTVARETTLTGVQVNAGSDTFIGTIVW